jgi:transcriptional regulator with XRE-family HTH domain
MKTQVPQYRTFRSNKANDLIAKKCKQLCVTRQILAERVGMSRANVNRLLITQPNTLKPRHIKAFTEALGMSYEEARQVYFAAALMQGYQIGLYKGDRNVEAQEEE